MNVQWTNTVNGIGEETDFFRKGGRWMKDIFSDKVLESEIFNAVGKIVANRLLSGFEERNGTYEMFAQYSDCSDTIRDLLICCDPERERNRLERLIIDILSGNDSKPDYFKFVNEFGLLLDDLKSEKKFNSKFPPFKKKKKDYPVKKLTDYFSEYIQSFADKKKITFDQMIEKLMVWYDSYLFHEEGTKVFNPVSLFTALKKKDLQNYWYQTGGKTTFLMQRISSTNYDYRLLDNDVKYLKDSLINYKDENLNMELIPLLYYSGYLTIKSAEEDCDIVEYTLGFPNNEVKISFLTNIIDYFYHSDIRSGFDYLDFSRDFRNGNVDGVLKRFQALFSSLPYADDKNVVLIERDFQNVIFLVFSILGHFAISEPHFSKGRADCILINKDFVFIFEFKVDRDAQTALSQIDMKNYAGRFKMDGRKIFKVGVNFSCAEKNITDWVVAED
jgi:hypothetical protein